MSSSATLTLYSGPGQLTSGMVLTNVTDFEFDLQASVLRVKSNGQDSFYALSGGNTITCTASGGNYTLTVS